MRGSSLIVSLAALQLPSSAANAHDFDWHSATNQRQMHTSFAGAAKTCAATFGFKTIGPQTEAAAIDKLDAHLLLKEPSAANLTVENWATDVIEPIAAILKDKSEDSTAADDKRAASAAVAASEDPETFDQAKVQFVKSALAPFERALDACTAGAGDPFLGKYYWKGTGSTDKVKAEFSNWFSEFVSELKQKNLANPH